MKPLNRLGIAIKVTSFSRGWLHVGIVHRRENGSIFLAHLAGHMLVENDPAPNNEGYLWSDCEWLSDPELYALADNICTHVNACAQNKEIPYGPNPPDLAFKDGKYIGGGLQTGLTCATWIAFVLEDCGYPVVEIETWLGRPDDQEWWESLSSVIAPQRVKELANVVISFRLRPEEVAVAAANLTIPLAFEAAITAAAPLLDQLLS